MRYGILDVSLRHTVVRFVAFRVTRRETRVAVTQCASAKGTISWNRVLSKKIANALFGLKQLYKESLCLYLPV